VPFIRQANDIIRPALARDRSLSVLLDRDDGGGSAAMEAAKYPEQMTGPSPCPASGMSKILKFLLNRNRGSDDPRGIHTMISTFVILKDGLFLQWNGVGWTDDPEDAAMFAELNAVFDWADILKVDVCQAGWRLDRREFTWHQFRTSLAKRY